ncbi:MAG: hypothetical protein R3286_21345, partial [Gammaproteobacteria bacterium]|nr:hypothetical protein [Gammaproteobacteria bacterium]
VISARPFPAKALGAAFVAVLAGMPMAHAEREPTTQTSIGIFYQPGAPETADLWREGDRGERLALRGRVLDRDGRPVAGALVELWHADAAGGVNESRFRAAQRTTDVGRFGIRTVLPGHIEMARDNAVFRARHIHIRVTHPDHPELVSLIFFRGDERLEGTPYPELAISLERARLETGEVLVGGVEIVLGANRLPRRTFESTD